MPYNPAGCKLITVLPAFLKNIFPSVQGIAPELCYYCIEQNPINPKPMKRKHIALIILTAIILASCTSYVCPTYAKYNPHKKVKVKYK
jgi:hypothetical protein